MNNANTRQLHDLGQSLWLDNITRQMLGDGTLQRYIDELCVTGLTSNPTIFEHAIGAGDAYDAQIAELARDGRSGEALFFALATRDLVRAADLFRPIHHASGGVDGWVSLEVSPLLANDARKTIDAARRLHANAGRPNVYIKIPGTPAGLDAIEESIFEGVPINVTLLFSREQYIAAAEAYMRGIERRIAAGRDPVVESVASIFVSRWDVAVARPGAGRTAQPARPGHRDGVRTRPTASCWLRRAGPAVWRRRASAAAALGQHRDQGPGRLRHPLRGGARGAGHGQHDAGQDAARACRPRPDRRADGRSTAATPRARSPSSERPASTKRRSPSGCSAKAPRRSSKSWRSLLAGIDRKVAQLTVANPR